MEKSDIKKKIVLIGIAGSPDDFLLSLPVLKCYLYQNEYIKNSIDLILKQYPLISNNAEDKVEEILKEIDEIKPEIIGLSCYVWNMDVMKLIIKGVKERHNAIKIILGGPEIDRKDILAGKFDALEVDFLIFGEGEKSMLKLLESFLGFDNTNYNGIRGVAYKKNGLFLCNEEAYPIEEINLIPSPYLSGYISDEILHKPNIRVNIETQRGCNFRCAYCFYHKNFPRIRYRDADVVINEIDYAYKRGVRIGRILDANFLSKKEFAKKIIKGLIKHKIEVSLFFEMLPIFLDEELAQLIGEYRRISPNNRIMTGLGIQTINQDSLAVIRRKIPLWYFEKAFNLLQKEDVIIKSDIILGLPLETKETYFQTMEFITEKMRRGTNYLSLSLLRILPGTELVEIAKKINITIDKRDGSHFVYETLTMPRKDLLECLRINTVAFRLLSSIDIEKRMVIRDLYFDVKDKLQVTNIELLQYFVKEFFDFLKDKETNYAKPDFPDVENYACKEVYKDIPDEWLIKKLESLKVSGML